MKGMVPQDFKDAVIVPVFKKGNKSDLSNYRGISLLSIAGKVLTTIIRMRISDHYEKTIRKQQAGFRKGKGCVDQIFSIRQCIERRLRFGQSTIITFIDFAAAFDSVHRDSMWKILQKCGIPQPIIDILINMYSNASSKVRTEDGVSSPFDITSGVRQGCVISPILFNIVLDQIMNKSINGEDGIMIGESIYVNDFDYADDIAIMQPDEKSTQSLLGKITENAEKLGLRIKPSETKIVTIHSQEPSVYIYGEKIETVDSFTYLGSVITGSAISPAEDVNNRINKASSVFGRLRRNIWDRKDIQIETKMKIYNTAVLPTLLYASETWCLTKNITSKLEVFQMSCLRNIAGISKRRHTTNIEVRNICYKQQTIESMVEKN